jgi:hypothetical protein
LDEKKQLIDLFLQVQQQRLQLISNKDTHHDMCQKTVENCQAKNKVPQCVDKDDFDNLENVLKLNIKQKDESDMLLDKFNKLLEDNKNDCNNLNKIFLDNKTRFSQDIEYIEIVMDRVRAMLEELIEKHKEKETLKNEETSRQLLEETIRDTIMDNLKDDLMNTMKEVVKEVKKEDQEDSEKLEEEEVNKYPGEFIAEVRDPEYNQEAEGEEDEEKVDAETEIIAISPTNGGQSLLQSGSQVFSNAFSKVENFGSSLLSEVKTYITGTSLFQLPSNDQNNINKIFIELSIKLNDTTEKEKTQYLLTAHQKMKLILDNVYLSLNDLYTYYQESSNSCVKRLSELTERRNDVRAAKLLNQLEIEKIASKK